MMKRIYLLLAIAVVFAGCAKPYHPPTVQPDGAEFIGLETASPRLTPHTSTLIMIHGMCDHQMGWVSDTAAQFADGFGYPGYSGGLTTVKDGGMHGVSAYRADLRKESHRLTIYGIVYGPVTFPIKQAALCRDVIADTPLCPYPPRTEPKRASINAAIKHTLVDDCLGDVTVYLGDTGNTIRAGVREALHAIVDDRGKDPDISGSPLFLLSESLGSKVLRDSLLCRPDPGDDRVFDMLADTAQVFMSANQLPLLNLAGMAEACVSKTVFSGESLPLQGDFSDLMRLIDKAKARRLGKRSIPEPTKIVAFSDPNDLLSYEVIADDYGGRETVNVRVSNGFTYFGALESPLKAHLGYTENPDVLKLIQCGSHGVDGNRCRQR
jgi:hypothetical protein